MKYGLTWTELVDECLRRIRELASPIREESDIPYYTVEKVERTLHEATLEIIREMPAESLLSSPLVSEYFFVGSTTMPPDVIRILGARIKATATTTHAPAVEVRPAAFLQMAKTTSDVIAIYSFYGGSVHFKGVELVLAAAREPTLPQLRAVNTYIPVFFDEERINRTVQRLLFMDHLQEAL